MKLRYYLRGLGVGILVTAFLMARLNPPAKMTDAQIKQRAKELGMVEEKYLSEITVPEEKLPKEELPEEKLSEKEELPEEETPVEVEEAPLEELPAEELPEGEETPEGEAVEEELPAETETPEKPVNEETTVEAEQPETPEAPQAEENYIVITIERGNGSDTVSRKLFEAGLIDSAAEYDKYLIANGYDRKLSIGNHEIPVNASEEEMAKILCGQR